MRHLIYELVRPGDKEHRIGRIYDIAIVIVVLVSLIPMMSRGDAGGEKPLDIITADILFFDYVLKWMTYDIRRGQEGNVRPFLLYLINPVALVTFISLLPSFGILGESWRVLRILRIMTLFGYSKHCNKIINVFRRQKDQLGLVFAVAVLYIFATALLVFVSEPETFKDFFQAIYWSTTMLTTVGYGDIAPVSYLGRTISMLSSIVGIAVIALPAGIITSGFMSELEDEKKQREMGTGAEAESDGERSSAPAQVHFMNPEQKAAFPRYMIIMTICVAVNCVLLTVCRIFKLPMWLDTMGTVFASVMLEPCAGIIVGFLTNCLETYTFYEGAIMYFLTSAVIAIIPGLLLRTRGGGIRRNKLLPVMALTISASALVATVLTVILGRGYQGNYWEKRLYQMLLQLGLGEFGAMLLPTLLTKILDMGIIFIVIWLVSRSKAVMDIIHGGDGTDRKF